MSEIISKVKYQDDGKSLPAGIGQNISENEEAPALIPVTAPVGPTNREFFGDLDKVSLFPDDLIIINDITLSDIPVQVYNLESQNDVFVGETLRTKAPIISSKGRQSFSFYLSLVFPPGSAQSIKLRRVIAEITKNPLVYIYNNKIRNALGIKDPSISSIFIVESGTLRNAAGSVGPIVLDLNIHYFNYKPFSNHFWFNAKMPGYRSTEREARPDLENTIDLTELSGYEANSYSLEYEAENITERLRSGALRLDTPNNVPVNFPASSDAWMHYANHMVTNSNAIQDRTSDYVGFDLKYFKLINPAHSSQRQGTGNAKEQFTSGFSSKNYADIYDAMTSPTIAEQGKTATDKQVERLSGSSSSTGYGHFPIQVTFAKTGKTVTGQLVDQNGKVITDTHRALSEACYTNDKALKSDKPLLSTKLMFMIQKIVDTWPNKKITIYSAWRNYKKGTSPHAKGLAIDFKVSGVSNVDLFLFIATTFDSGGAGYYPNNASTQPNGGSKFVHMDSMTGTDSARRPKKGMMLWCDASLSREKAKSDPSNPVLLKAKAIRNTGRKASIDIEQETRLAKIAITEEKEHQDKEIRDEKIMQEAQMNEKLQNRGCEYKGSTLECYPDDTKNIVYTKTGDRNAQARFNWISDLSSQGWNYYWEDPKLRNIFYRNINFDISSNPIRAKYLDKEIGTQAYRTEYADNMVCTAISVSFGHRIVPQKLLSQDSTTWQFWGAGNKSGTLVFEFAGPSGKVSADKLKRMFYGARENARKFSSLLPEAGSLGIRWTHPNTGEINSILALLDIRNIVITDIKENSISGSADKYQLQISFISQEFEKEEFDQRFSTSIDNKKRIVRGIMNLLRVYTPGDGAWKPKRKALGGLVSGHTITDWQLIKPWSKYIEERRQARILEEAYFEDTGEWYGGKGRPYVRKPDMPKWLADVVIEAAEICNELDNSIPPTSLTSNKDTGETWSTKYKEWGAGIIKGRKHLTETYNADPSPVNIQNQQQALFASQASQPVYKADFEKNNEVHSRAYIKWLNRMNILVDKIRRHANDHENFKKFFGSVAEEELDNIIAGLNSCYKDMDLPKLIDHNGKEGRLSLPPEFYIYDDSHENTTFSSLTDEANLAPLLERHIESEVASIEHFCRSTLLGGSYLSRNLPNILEERKRHLDTFGGKDRKANGWQGEMGFLTFGNMMMEGLSVWDPVFYNPETPDSKETLALKWFNTVKDHFGSGDVSAAKTKYLDDLIKLSPYLRDGHNHWSSYSGAPTDYLVRTIYDEDYQSLSFGPNPEYTHIDSVIDGNITDKKTDNILTSLKISEYMKEHGYSGNVGNKATDAIKKSIGITSDQTYLAGANIEEKEQQDKLDTARKVEKVTQFNATTTILSALNPITFMANTYVLATNAVSGYVADKTEEKIKEDIRSNNGLSTYNKLNDMPLHIVSKQFSGNENSKLAELSTGIALGSKAKDLSVRRAFPTFKIFFIEDDSHQTTKSDGKVIRAFDDFYSYSAVQEIRISRSRKIAADMAVIRITNIAGKLLRKRFGEKEPYQIEEEEKFGKNAEYATGIFADTKEENPFERMILKDGIKVQIRLGYANNPDSLESVFLGSIVEISPSEGGKILELVCQGYGAELEGVELGPLEDGPEFYSSQQVLSGAIIQDSIVNFGRRSKFNKFNPGETRSRFVGGEGKGILGSLNPLSLYSQWGQKQLYRDLYRYPFKNYPQDDNIYAPSPYTYTNSWESFCNNACLYRPIRQTPWQIFKEHELRHPGYISMAVPYGHSARMTMFFGAKGQHYWCKPPSDMEIYIAENATDAVTQLRSMSYDALTSPTMIKKLTTLANGNEKLVEVMVESMGTYGKPTSVGQEIGKIFGRYRPFRNYHYFDSSHHILKNNIRTGIDGTFNEVTVLYFDNENDAQEDDAEDISNNIQAMQRGEKGVFSCKLDDNIPEQYIRSYREEFPSCVTEFMAKRYAQGLFARLMRDAYRGEFIVLGEPTLKPYDICYINDTSIGMSGPVEVEAVEHILNRDQGWISIVTPDLCLDVNDFYSASVFDVTGAALSNLWGGLDETFATLATSLITPIGYLAIAGGVKFMTLMQEGSPVVATPLTLEGKPFISVGMGAERSSLILQQQGKWRQYWDDLNQAWDDLDIAEEIFELGLNMNESLYGLLSNDVSITEVE